MNTLEIRSLRALRGPNIWTRSTVLEAVCDSSTASPELLARVRSALPGFDPSTALAASPTPYGALAATDSTAHLVVRIALEMQARAGSAASFGRTAILSDGTVKAAVEYREEEVGRKAFAMAQALLADATFDAAKAIEELRSLDQNVRLGPSTGSIVRAAQARGIPARRLNDGSLVQFGWGAKQRRILAAETDRTSAIAESIAQDKELTKMLLRSVGVPVPEGRPVESAEDAWEAAQEIDAPVVVKPQYGSQGRGVAVNLTTREQVLAAFAAAREEGSSILVEKFSPGDDYRLLVIGTKLVAAAIRHSPRVVGDGKSTIRELVDEVNKDPRRGEDHATSLSKLKLDAIGLAVLAEQGFTADSIPAANQIVVLRRNANLSTGGTAKDVTDLVHPEVAARAVDAARVVGLDIAGVDVIAQDIRKPLEMQGGVIVEVNAAPGLRMHLEPSEGTPRAVGEAIIDLMFAPGETGRVPVVAVTGNNGKTTTTRLIAHLFAASGKRVGWTCSDGIYIEGRRIDDGDCSGPKSARAVLQNPVIEAAVFETARGGLLREGLGFDRADVAIVTNIGEGDHLSMNGIDTLDQLAAAKGILVGNVAAHGAAVLNAADPLTLAMVSRASAPVILFARNPENEAIRAHTAKGGRAVFVRSGAVVLSDGGREQVLVTLAEVPLTKGGIISFQVENVLASVAAAWSLKLPFESVRAGLATFVGGGMQTPARFDVRRWGSRTIVIDYGHNPDALLALIEAIDGLPHAKRALCFTAAGDRRDVDIVRQGEIVAQAFDRIVVFEDACNRGRADGEVVALLKQGFVKGTRTKDYFETTGEQRALTEALRGLGPNDLLLALVDQVDESIAFLDELLATPPADEAPRRATG